MKSAKVKLVLDGVGVVTDAHYTRLFRRVLLEVTTIYGKPALYFIPLSFYKPQPNPSYSTYDERMQVWLERWAGYLAEGEHTEEGIKLWGEYPAAIQIAGKDLTDLRTRARLRWLRRNMGTLHMTFKDFSHEIDFVMELCSKYMPSQPLRNQRLDMEMLTDPSRSPLLRPTDGLGARIWRPTAPRSPDRFRGPEATTVYYRIGCALPGEVERYYLPASEIRDTYLSARYERNRTRTDLGRTQKTSLREAVEEEVQKLR